MDYLIGTLNDGSTVRISKADLAAVVGGLLPITTTLNKGLMPTCSYLRINSVIPKWYLLAHIAGGIAVSIDACLTSYQNTLPLKATFNAIGYSNLANLKVYLTGNIQGSYNLKLKYKKDASSVKIWCFAGDISMMLSRPLSNVLIEQEPDEDSIDITDNI